jgi:hypothetical protein
MAQYLATTTTLQSFKAQVRGQLQAQSLQETGVFDPEMNDLVHQAVSSVRAVMGTLLDAFYRTSASVSPTGTTPNFSISIAANEIADVRSIALYNGTLKQIPIMSRRKYDAIRSLYSAAEIGTTNGIATITNTATAANTQSVLMLYVYSNVASSSTLANTEMSYSRYPKKVTVESDTLDLPESFVPFARDICTLYLAKRLERKPSSDVVESVKAQLAAVGATLNIEVPANNTQE